MSLPNPDRLSQRSPTLRQKSQSLSPSSTNKDTHYITAMTFNIGDANIKTPTNSNVMNATQSPLLLYAENTMQYKLLPENTVSSPQQPGGNTQSDPLSKNIFEKILNKHFRKENETKTILHLNLPDILIIGLQEVPKTRVTTIQKEFEDELAKINSMPSKAPTPSQNATLSRNATDGTTTGHEINQMVYRFVELSPPQKYLKICSYDFNILTMVMVSENVSDCGVAETIKVCPGILAGGLGTKGFSIIKLEYKLNGQPATPIYIVNLHAPFKSIEKTTDFFETLFSKLPDIPTHLNNNNIIINNG